MKNKITLAILAGAFLFLSASAYAHEHSMGSFNHGMTSHTQSQCPVADKFMKKAHLLLENKTELGLTDDQVKAIKELKLQAEKDGIRQNADKEIFMLDLKSKLEEDKVDVEGANALVDKGFASAATATKSNVEAYTKLKASLTPEQLKKMKEILKNKKEAWENKASKRQS